MPFTPARIQKYVLFVLAALLFLYVAARALLLELTPDEVFSVTLWAKQFTVYPETYTDLSANHHWLNSWGMWFFSGIFGDSDFVLRLPNVLAYLVYLYFSYRIATQIAPARYLLVVFLLLNVHPYLLDFFSLARGYGLALAGGISAVFYLGSFLKEGRIAYAFYALLASSFALLANFNVLPIYIITVALLVAGSLPYFRSIPGGSFRMLHPLLLLAFSIALLALIMPHLLAMQNANALYYGSTTLWEGTAGSLATGIAYDAPYAGDNHFCSLKPIIHFMNGVIIVAIFFYFRQRDIHVYQKIRNLATVLLLPALLLVLFFQHYLLDVLYPSFRTGLPLFMLYMIAFAQSFIFLCTLIKHLKYMPWLVALPFLAHFSLSANFSYTREWRSTGELKQFTDRIALENKQAIASGKKITLSTNGVPGVVLDYFSKKPEGSWLQVQTHWDTTAFPAADYYILEKGNYRYLKNKNLVPLDTNRNTGNILFKQGNAAN
jgi:hypothetical protein